MAAAARTAKQILKAYKAVRRVEVLTQAKLDALLETNAQYKLFEPDTRHPYHVIASSGKSAAKEFEALIAGVLQWELGSGSIAEEIDKVKARQIVDETAADEDLDALRAIQQNVLTEADAAKMLLTLFSSVNVTRTIVSTSIINGDLAILHGKRNVPRHKEKPEVKITTECGDAVREVKKLAKELRDCGNGSSTIRQELEKNQVLRELSGQGKDFAIQSFLK
jgi:hypothetical protein